MGKFRLSPSALAVVLLAAVVVVETAPISNNNNFDDLTIALLRRFVQLNKEQRTLEKKDTVFDKIRDIIVKLKGSDAREVIPDALLVEDLALDDVEVMEFFMILANEFELEIPDEDAELIRTVGDAMAYVKANKSEY